MSVSVSTFYLFALRHLPGMGPVTILSLLEGELKLPQTLDHEAVFTALKTIERFTRKKRIKAALELLTLEAWTQICAEVEKHLHDTQAAGVGVLGYFDPLFPERLQHCPATTQGHTGKEDPPLWLYYQGDIERLTDPTITIIGSREPTPNGLYAAHFFAERFAVNGFNVVSGLAAGCDEGAHRGALTYGGITTAILASGHKHPLNPELAQDILKGGGLLLSEYAPDTQNEPYMFVKRDRLQAGLGLATIVIQTKVDGGTMHAVHATQNAQKPLYVVQYRHQDDLTAPQTAGNLQLLAEGYARPIGSATIDISMDELVMILREAAKYP